MKHWVVLVCMGMFVYAANSYALPPAVGSGYSLVWSDEFAGAKLDTNAWSFDTGAGQNGEQEFYSKANCTIDSGALVLWAKRNDGGHAYTSCRVNTAGKKEFKYGYFEAKMKAAQGLGLWPAVWLLGSSINHGVAWPTCGEIELYEARTGPDIKTNPCSEPSVPNVAGDNCFIATCHYGVNGTPSYHCGQRNYPACLCDRYHTYGVLWDSTHVEYYFDDTLYWGPNFPTGNGTPSITLPGNTTAFHNPFYWIMNVAVGGAYQGQQINNAIFPQKMNIDYVKVYQKGTTGINNIAAGHPLRSFGLVNPSSARLKVYDMSGRLVADYSARVRSMKPGDDALRSMSPPLPNGAYIAALVDKGNSISKKFAVAR